MKQINGIYLPDREEAWIYDAVKSTGTFETDRIPVMLQYTKQMRRAIDGGANCGLWSIELAKHFETVEAFECADELIEPLLLNTKDMNITVRQQALGYEFGHGAMGEYRVKTNSGSGYVVEGSDFEIVPIDSFGWDDVDVLKLDIEGMEYDALCGALETIKVSYPVILIEQKFLSHRVAGDILDAGKFVEGLGYKLMAKINKDYIYAHE